jgi:hypothetical protein
MNLGVNMTTILGKPMEVYRKMMQEKKVEDIVKEQGGNRQIGNAWNVCDDAARVFYIEADVFGIENLGGFNFDEKTKMLYWWWNV